MHMHIVFMVCFTGSRHLILSKGALYAFLPGSVWFQCLEHFLKSAYHHSNSQRTVYVYRGTLHRFFSEPQKMPDAYTRRDIEAFLERRSQSRRNSGAEISTATRNQRLAVIRSFYSFAASYTVEGEDGQPVPILRTHPPTLGMKSGKPSVSYRALSLEELKKIFAVIPTDTLHGVRNKAILMTYFWTCRRRSEIERLRYGDIFQGIIIDPDGTRRIGWLYKFHNKGASTVDDVAELPAPAKAAIDAYLLASGRLASIKTTDPLFTVIGPPTGGKALDPNAPISAFSTSYILKRYAVKAGIDPSKFSLHVLRHTGARMRYESGEDLRSISRLLRHSNIAVTDTYLRALSGTSDIGAKLLEARLGSL